MRSLPLLVLAALVLFPTRALGDPGYVEQQCRAGKVETCELAANLREDDGDIDGAVELTKRSCKPDTCTLWQLANRVSANGNPTRAATIVKDSCETYADQMSCYQLANRYRDGDGIARDLPKAVALFRRLCELPKGYGIGCQELSRLYKRGEGVPKSAAKAAQLQSRLAKIMDDFYFANEKSTAASVAANRASYETSAKGCVEGKADGCGTAVLLHLEDDVELAAKSAMIACKADAKQCYLLFMPVTSFLHRQKPSRAAELLQEGCDHDQNLCGAFAGWLAEGRLLPKDLPRARRLFIAACDSGLAYACDNAAQMTEDGEGGPRNAAVAVQLYRRGKLLASEIGDATAVKKRKDEHLAAAKQREAQDQHTAASVKMSAEADKEAAERKQLDDLVGPYEAELTALRAEEQDQRQSRRDGDRLGGGSPLEERRADWRATTARLIGEAVDAP